LSTGEIRLSTKNIAIGAVILVSIISFISLLGETYIALQSINPIAIIAAVTVAFIGIIWFKKTTN
jgi:hypothetical protein